MAFANLPIKEQTTQLILAQLATLVAGGSYTTEAGVIRTYQISLAGVERVKLATPNQIKHLLVILREGDDREPTPADAVDDGGAPIRHQRWFRPYCATIYLGDNDPEVPFDQLKNVASADLLNCLLQNRQQINADGQGLADDTYPRGTLSFETGDDLAGIDVNFEVLYTTAEDDSYSL
jgi:hypothetical protein